MTGSVGILAYGSLIADPGQEIVSVRSRVTNDLTTPFPVEYARSSSGRGGAPTLVPYENGGSVRAQLFLVETSVQDAMDRLYRREINAIGSNRPYQHKKYPGPNDVVVDQIEKFAGVDVVLFTRIAPTIDSPTASILADLAISSVTKTDEKRDGISYLANAMAAGIRTPLTEEYAAEILRRTGTNSLADALAKTRLG